MKFVIYKDAVGKFRWRLYAPRDRLLAHGFEAFDGMSECMDAVMLVRQSNIAEVEDQTRPE